MLFVDCETYSDEPIKNGTFKYAEKCELLLVAWAIDDGPVKVWDYTESSYSDFANEVLLSKDIILAHNAAFEAAVFAHCLPYPIDPKRWRCTMAQAYAHGLPGGLDALGAVLGLKQVDQKYKTGHDLIRLFCIPPAKNSKRTERATRLTHPKEWELFRDYCRQDIIATREIYKKLPKWNYQGFELDLWHLDQKINTRGVPTDIDLPLAVMRAVDLEQAKLKNRTIEATEGELSSTTKRDATLKYILETYKVTLPDMQASTLERRIEDPDLPEGLKELLRIRLQASTSSTAKYKRVLSSVCSDGRLRGMSQFCGASRTGRDAGRILNLYNLPRPTLKQDEIEFGIECFKNNCADITYGNVMEIASNAIRGIIHASPGKKFVIADLKNIEGRFAAWLAGEGWKLTAFAEYDAGRGWDLYILSYSKSFRVKPEDVTKEQRNSVGKTLELSMQFGGGCGAFVTFALGFGIDLAKLVQQAWDSIPKNIIEESSEFWEYAIKQKRTLGLEKDVFITCDSLKRLWRNAHPNIVSLWKELEEAARNAIATPGKTFEARKLKAQRDGNWLRILLPSGRYLCYPHPQVNDKGQISFSGVDQYSRQWGRIETYGPKLFENSVQGGSRDVFMYGLVNASNVGYDNVLRVYDEQINEVQDEEKYNAKELCELMTTNIPWCEGLPLAADGFECFRYRKGG